jgi:hypothetical protein
MLGATSFSRDERQILFMKNHNIVTSSFRTFFSLRMFFGDDRWSDTPPRKNDLENHRLDEFFCVKRATDAHALYTSSRTTTISPLHARFALQTNKQ